MTPPICFSEDGRSGTWRPLTDAERFRIARNPTLPAWYRTALPSR